MILITDPADVIGKHVMHCGAYVGTVVDVRPCMEKGGRRYAYVQACNAGDPERRIPLDELRIEQGL